MKKKRRLPRKYLTILKYIFTAALIFAASYPADLNLLSAGLMQLAVIFLVTDVLLKYSRFFRILNFILIILLNIQYAVLYFANSFVTLTMLQNLDSLADLSGKAVQYILGVAAVILISAIPVRSFSERSRLPSVLVKILLAIALQGAVLVLFRSDSPYAAYGKLINDYRIYQEMTEIIENQKGEIEPAKTDTEEGFHTDSVFYRSEVKDHLAKPQSLPDQTNIILVFTEGISSNIIDDWRNIMPVLSQLREEAISFESYYSHTFATYHALQGQLFSGYQFNNYDKNNLVSIHKLLKNYYYTSCFINTEPGNAEFSVYLDDMKFDSVVASDQLTSLAGMQYVSDKDAYALLFDKAEELNKEENPFFLSMYSFGTHVSLDSPDEVFEDGSDPLLNKFYNLDHQFGQFLEKFKNSPLYDNTLLIFTGDHAAYQDQDFSNSFPGYYREITTTDVMPLFFYHKGIIPERIDVSGRTSIDLVPTILDYLDISDENYFMGESLFKTGELNEFECISWNAEYAVLTADGNIQWITGEGLSVLTDMLQQYFALSTYEPEPSPSEENEGSE